MNQFEKARIKKLLRKDNDPQTVMQAAARYFGTHMGNLVRQGVPPEMAFEATVERMQVYAKGMIEFAQLVPQLGINPNKMEADRQARAAGKNVVTLTSSKIDGEQQP
jgi:hypothetical protein